MSVSSDGKLDDSGPFMMVWVYASEGGLYAPSLLYAYETLALPTVTCNSKESLDLVLQAQMFSSLVLMLMVAPCVVEKITSGEGYW